jgi:uncharacterized Zn-finger protein
MSNSFSDFAHLPTTPSTTRPFICNVEGCGYRAAQKSHLNVHTRKHNDDKRFVCTVCDYRATVKTHLTNHMRTYVSSLLVLCMAGGAASISHLLRFSGLLQAHGREAV